MSDARIFTKTASFVTATFIARAGRRIVPSMSKAFVSSASTRCWRRVAANRHARWAQLLLRRHHQGADLEPGAHGCRDPGAVRDGYRNGGRIGGGLQAGRRHLAPNESTVVGKRASSSPCEMGNFLRSLRRENPAKHGVLLAGVVLRTGSESQLSWLDSSVFENESAAYIST
jgi:hypothetical protein